MHETITHERQKKQLHIFILLSVLFLIAISIRLFGYYLESLISRDGITYLELSQKWYDTNDFSQVFQGEHFWIPPMFLFCIKCLMGIGFHSEQAALILNLTAGAAIPVFGYFIALELSRSRWIAWWGAVSLCLHPVLIELSYMIQRENLYLFFLLTSLLSFLYAQKNDHLYLMAIAGAVLVMAILTRFEAMEFLMIYPLLIVIYWIKKTHWRRNIILNIAVLVAGELLGLCMAILLLRIPISFFLTYWLRLSSLIGKF